MFHENICCGYSLEVPLVGTSNEYLQQNSDFFLISAQNIDCEYSLELLNEAVPVSTHNLCF